MRKWPSIDLVKLRATSSISDWNIFLDNCIAKSDINRLTEVMYGLQAGMTDVAKQKLNSTEICTWFVRLTRSIEKAVKSILREKYPLPNDKTNKLEDAKKFLAIKRKRDLEFNQFLERSRF